MDTAAMSALIERLPKAELHVHAEACLEPELLLRLAERNGHAVPYDSIEDVRRAYDWPTLEAFLDVYYRHMDVLQTAADYEDLVGSYVRHAHAQGVRHVELFFDPQAHTRRGVALETVVEGLTAGLRAARREHGITGSLLACFLRELGVASAQDTLREIAALDAPEPIIGIGLDSIEVGFPPPMFAPLYAQATALGLHRVIHAGEADVGANVGLALRELDVERVDHGVRCLDDPDTVAALLERGTTLTVCPLANIRTGEFATLADHPLPRLIEAGIDVTVNSDGPAYFGGYIADNWRKVQREFGFDAGQMVRFAEQSVDASFADDARKRELRAEIAVVVADAGVPR